MGILKKSAKKNAAPKAAKATNQKKSLADKVRADYNTGVNHQALAEKFDLSVEEVSKLIGV